MNACIYAILNRNKYENRKETKIFVFLINNIHTIKILLNIKSNRSCDQ